MDLNLLAAWWALSFSLVMTPGPDWAYTISAGLRDRAIVPAISGTLLGYAMITAVVAGGVGSLVSAVPAVLTALTLFGAAYLVYIGSSILARPPVLQSGGVAVAASPLGWMMRGFTVTGTNPKAIMLFLALLPQFTSARAALPVAAQISVLGMVQIVNCAIVYSAVGYFSKTVLQSRPVAARRVSQFSGAAMLLIALALLGEQAVAWMQG